MHLNANMHYRNFQQQLARNDSVLLDLVLLPYCMYNSKCRGNITVITGDVYSYALCSNWYLRHLIFTITCQGFALTESL